MRVVLRQRHSPCPRLFGSLFKPLIECCLLHDLHHDRHEAMIHSTKLGALAAIDARLVDDSPEVVDGARHRVALDAKVRHPPCVNDVLRGNEETNLTVDRNSQRLVHLQQVIVALGATITNFILAGG